MSDKAKLVKRLAKFLPTALADQIAEEVVDSLWLAEHDAEVRAAALAEAAQIARSYDTGYDTTAATIAEAVADAGGVVAEEPEWEYGWNWLSHPYTEAKPFSPQGDEQSRTDFVEKTGRQISPVQMYRRTPAVPAGEWVPVKQESDDA